MVASKFTILPDGSKVFTSDGQVWSGNLQTQLGTLQGSPGTLIKLIPGQNAVALASEMRLSSSVRTIISLFLRIVQHLVGMHSKWKLLLMAVS